MSSVDYAIEVNNLVKAFRSWECLPDRQLKSQLISLLKMNFKKSKYQTVAVLDDVTFSVNRGEFLGIMGRNGIGKSTILKLISGIYAPTSGSVVSHGRVIPLLELGAGFDPELTGYENIFLNATILGYKPKVIRAVLKQIVDFSELGPNLNMLIKNYSSGMLVRLGFSIAVHLEFDILLLDEVLGVGDIGFMQKSVSKIQELNRSGKTIILVTHSPEQVAAYCSRCIVLNKQKLFFDGAPSEAAQLYKTVILGN